MNTMLELDPDAVFEKWYVGREVLDRDGCLDFRNVSPYGDMLWSKYQNYKREMDMRVAKYDILEQLADNEVISPKPDLPNVSSGETAGLVRRIARNLVQNCPNVEVVSVFDDDSVEGIFSKHILTSKVIFSDTYSNDMQQNLFASTKTAFTLGFACVIPVLLQDAGGAWYMKYDTIHYRDVFPEPGAKDIRDTPDVFIRRYLSIGDVKHLVNTAAPGWDIPALRRLLKNKPRAKEMQSVNQQQKKHHQIPDGYEIITWYNSFGQPFLTFSATEKTLLRVEKNKHPLKEHPVHFLVLEKDDQQPLGKSQVELLIGRQEFQDLMLNGAMKLWYRNINPSILGFGTGNTLPNLGPGKYTAISNPNAKVEPFEVNTGTLMQYSQISAQNLGSMVNLIGNTDQQMSAQAGNGMSQTPQGVDAQQQVVDITTNNYQKAIEAFFSRYCSYALTLYFQELKGESKFKPTAETRIKLLKAGLTADKTDADGKVIEEGQIKTDGTLEIEFNKLAVEYFVRCVPGSLIELEDEKQLRLLNQMFVPFSQAIPALAAMQDQQMMSQVAQTLQYIVGRQIELSGAKDARDIIALWSGKEDVEQVNERDARVQALEAGITGLTDAREEEAEAMALAIQQLQANQGQIVENLGLLMDKLGVPKPEPTESSTTPVPETGASVDEPVTVLPASA